MPRSKAMKRVQKFGELVSFRDKRLRCSSPSPPSTPSPAVGNIPTNTPDTTPVSNPISESSAGPSQVIIGPGDLAQPVTAPRPAQSTRVQPPNFQSIAIPVPVRNEAFQKALLESLGKLSGDDKAAFQSATDVMNKLGEFQQGKSRISSSHATLTQKVQKVLRCVGRFLTSITIGIQNHPEISSLVVGGLHCVLTVSTCPFLELE